MKILFIFWAVIMIVIVLFLAIDIENINSRLNDLSGVVQGIERELGQKGE